MIVVESKSVPSYFWAKENADGRAGRGILEIDGHVFRVCVLRAERIDSAMPMSRNVLMF